VLDTLLIFGHETWLTKTEYKEKFDKAKSEHDQMDLWVYYERKKRKTEHTELLE